VLFYNRSKNRATRRFHLKKKLSAAIALALIACLLIVILMFEGVIRPNPSHTRYPVRGVDVSSYQGDIDWHMLEAQGISFAFIKATEGSGMIDPCFQQNFYRAGETSIRIGAYHFLSYDSPGSTQAENFIAAVPKTPGMLPPVIDVEFYGEYISNHPDKDHVSEILDDILFLLTKHYGLKPIIYVTRTSYSLYIKDTFDDYDLWIRDVYLHPFTVSGTNWTFWQYSDQGRLEGYEGVEAYIDLNVFNGTLEDFNNYAQI